MEGIARYLRDPDPDRIFSEGNLVEKMSEQWIESINSRAFGFQLFHEFPRQKETPAMRVVSPNWRDHIASVRSKHLLRLQRLLDLDRPDNSILFVRDRLDSTDDLTQHQVVVDDLWQTLKFRWPRADIQLLLINVPCFEPPSPQVIRLEFMDLPGPPPDAWRGDDRSWVTALESAGLMPQIGARALHSPPSPGEA